MPNYQGQYVDRTHSNGLSISECWQKLLDENEEAWDSNQPQKILDDDAIVEAMARWFPARMSMSLLTVHRARASANRKEERIRFYRYERKGQKARRITSRGGAISEWLSCLRLPPRKRRLNEATED